MLFSDPLASPGETLVAELRDYPEWHRGRRRYGVWVALVQDTALLAYIDYARAQIADLIHPSPGRQAHLTVFVCGFHNDGNEDDDFPPQRLHRQLSLLQPRAGSTCTLPLARPDSFASAAFIPVGDPLGRLQHWRRALSGAGEEIRQSPYVPHITLGLYRRCVSADVLRARLAAIEAPVTMLTISELRYVIYDARDPFGAVETVERVALSEASPVHARNP